MTKANIKFDKRNLERLKYDGKGKFYYAENFEGLLIYVGKKKKLTMRIGPSLWLQKTERPKLMVRENGSVAFTSH